MERTVIFESKLYIHRDIGNPSKDLEKESYIGREDHNAMYVVESEVCEIETKEFNHSDRKRRI